MDNKWKNVAENFKFGMFEFKFRENSIQFKFEWQFLSFYSSWHFFYTHFER